VSNRSNDMKAARAEAAALLGLDAEHLSPADNLRVDLVTSLRAAIDHAAATVIDGGNADLGRLITAVDTLVKLLPERRDPEHHVTGASARERLLKIVQAAIAAEDAEASELSRPIAAVQT